MGADPGLARSLHWGGRPALRGVAYPEEAMNPPDHHPLAVHWIELGPPIQALDPCEPEHRAQAFAAIDSLLERRMRTAREVALPWPEAGGLRFALHLFAGDLTWARSVERALLGAEPPRLDLPEPLRRELLGQIPPRCAHTPEELWRHALGEQAVHTTADLLNFLRLCPARARLPEEFDRLCTLAAQPELAGLRPVIGSLQRDVDRARAQRLARCTPWPAYARSLES